MSRSGLVPSRPAAVAAVLVVAAWAVSAAVLPRQGFWSGDSGCKYLQMRSLLASDLRRSAIDWPGRAIDPSFDFVPLRPPFGHVTGGEIHAQYSPVFALASAGPYRLLGFPGLFLLPILGGIATLAAVRRLARAGARSEAAGAVGVGIAALATPLWFYSFTFWEMMPAVALATWGVAFALRASGPGGEGAPRSRGGLPAAGAAVGASIAFRDDLYLFAIALGVAALLAIPRGAGRVRAALAYSGGLLATLAPLWAYQSFAVGNPLGLHFAATTPGPGELAGFLADRGAVFRNLFLNAVESPGLSALVSGPFVLLAIAFPRARLAPGGRGVAAIAVFAALAGAVVLAGHLTTKEPVYSLLSRNALFAGAPIAALAFVRGRPGRRPDASGPAGAEEAEGAAADAARDRVRRSLWLLLVLHAGAYALLAPAPNTEGIHWGCRFLLAAYPILAALAAGPIADGWSAARPPGGRRAFRIAVIAALVLSGLPQVHSIRLLRHRQILSERLNRIVAERPEPVVIATGWPVPQELSRVFLEKPVFLVSTPAELEELAARLRRAGYGRAVHVSWPPAPDRPGAGARTLVAEELSFPSFEVASLPLR